ncbi:MAG: DUF6600 domain-containing protein [Acidobacteriota bacterium]
MKRVRSFLLPTQLTCLLGLLCFFPSILEAETEPLSRVSSVEGTVAVAHEGGSEWELLERNFPIWRGDRFILAGKSRAEIEFNNGTIVRLGSSTRVVFQESSPGKITVQLHAGELLVNKKGDAFFGVVASGATTMLKTEGIYRFSLLESGTAIVRVRKGRARTVHGGLTVSLREGASWRISHSGAPLSRLHGIPPLDGFDEWSDLRDALRREQAVASSRPYTRYAGNRDLNRYGRWGYVSSHGMVWWPHANSEWIPYQRGHWVSGPLDHRVWISDEPWGWLPYHYGNWIYISYYSRWCWVPGKFNHWQPAAISVHLYERVFKGSMTRGPGSHQGGPLQRSGPRSGSGLGFRVKKISPNVLVPNRSNESGTGRPLGARIPVQSGRNEIVTRTTVRKVDAERSQPRFRVRRGVTTTSRSEVRTLKFERSSLSGRSQNARTSSGSRKVMMRRDR